MFRDSWPEATVWLCRRYVKRFIPDPYPWLAGSTAPVRRWPFARDTVQAPYPPPPLPNHCVWVKKYNQNSTQVHSKPNQKYKTPEIKSTHKPGIQSRKPDLQFFPPIPMLKLFILYNVFQCMFFPIFILSSRGKSCYLRQYIYYLKLSECFLHEIL